MGSCFSCSESRSPPLPSPNSPSGRKRKSFEKRCPSSSSFDYLKEEQLHRIPGRRFLNGSSEAASLFTQQGKKGVNQDAMLVWENFGSRADTVFCGVFDGHGPYGHVVAKRVRDSLPLKLRALWEVNVLVEGSQNTTESINPDIEEVSMASIDDERVHKNGDAFQTLKESFLAAFRAMDRELRTSSIDCFCSGTTTVALVKQGQDLVIGNVGDSRAILGTRNKDNFLTPVQLTVDLKPNLPAEAERIRRCKGRVFALRDEPDIARVWLPNTYSPGLAMSRAFGDFCLKDFGLISVPKISHRRLTEKDEFIILATDGIWDVLSNEEAVEIVGSARTCSSAARVLVEAAVRSWRTKYPTSRVDDCAVVCLFLADSRTNGAYSASSNAKAGPLAPNRVHNHENGREKWPSNQGVSRVDTVLTLPRVGSA